MLTVSVVVFGLVEQTESDPPKTAFDSQNGGGEVKFMHMAGENIDAEQIEAVGGNITSAPGTITAGETIAVEPDDEEVTLVYQEEDAGVSHILSSASSAQGKDTGGLPGSALALEGKEQYDQLLDRDLSDPYWLWIEVVDENGDPFTGNITVDDHNNDEFLWVTDHLGGYDDTPENRYGAYVALDFNQNGRAAILLGNGGSVDVPYLGLDVNDATESIEVNVGEVIDGLEVVAMSTQET